MRKRAIVAGLIAAIVVPLCAVGPARAATSSSCEFALLDIHFSTSRVLIGVQKAFSHDVFTFNRAAFAATSDAAITKAYDAATDASGDDFKVALSDMHRLRDQAMKKFKSGECSGASDARKEQEVSFFAAQELLLDQAYARGLAILRRTYRLMLAGCC